MKNKVSVFSIVLCTVLCLVFIYLVLEMYYSKSFLADLFLNHITLVPEPSSVTTHIVKNVFFLLLIFIVAECMGSKRPCFIQPVCFALAAAFAICTPEHPLLQLIEMALWGLATIKVLMCPLPCAGKNAGYISFFIVFPLIIIHMCRTSDGLIRTLSWICGAALLFFMVLRILEDRKQIEYMKSHYYAASGETLQYHKVSSDYGLLGEYEMESYLEQLNIPHKYLCNLYVPYIESKTEIKKICEIDWCLITSHDIYAIEVKNRNCVWMIENEHDDALILPEGSEDYELTHNPLAQNLVHIKSLNEYLDRKFFINGILCFGSRTRDFTTPENCRQICVRMWDFEETIERISRGDPKYDEAEINDIYEFLKPLENNPKYKLMHEKELEARAKEQGRRLII